MVLLLIHFSALFVAQSIYKTVPMHFGALGLICAAHQVKVACPVLLLELGHVLMRTWSLSPVKIMHLNVTRLAMGANVLLKEFAAIQKVTQRSLSNF